MNKVILMGRLTKDPEVRYTQEAEPLAIARYTLAVGRRMARNIDGQSTDFINCVVFHKGAEFAEKYLRKGIKIVISGRIQTRSYTNRYGHLAYVTEIVVDEQEFAESKFHSQQNEGYAQQEFQHASDGDGFINIPDGIDEELPFN